MREDLAREFPEAVRATSWARARIEARRPILWDESIVWAAISGIGAGFLVSAVVQSVIGLANEALQLSRSPTPFPLYQLGPIAADAAGAAIALAAGGPLALALDIAYVALGIALGIPGLMTFCERAGGAFPAPGPDRCTGLGFLMSLWPQLVGIGLGLVLARALKTRGYGINALLRVAGALALALFVMDHVWTATLGPTPNADVPGSLNTGLTVAAITVAAAVVAGAVAAQLPRGILCAAVVGGIWLLPWLTFQLPQGLRSLGSAVPVEYAPTILVIIAIQPIAAAFLVLSAAIAARSRFIPRDTA